jgi:hypothetical protein
MAHDNSHIWTRVIATVDILWVAPYFLPLFCLWFFFCQNYIRFPWEFSGINRYILHSVSTPVMQFPFFGVLGEDPQSNICGGHVNNSPWERTLYQLYHISTTGKVTKWNDKHQYVRLTGEQKSAQSFPNKQSTWILLRTSKLPQPCTSRLPLSKHR